MKVELHNVAAQGAEERPPLAVDDDASVLTALTPPSPVCGDVAVDYKDKTSAYDFYRL